MSKKKTHPSLKTRPKKGIQRPSKTISLNTAQHKKRRGRDEQNENPPLT